MAATQDPRCTAPGMVREVRDEVGTRGLEAVFHVAVPPENLLKILWDVENFDRLYPDIKESRVVGGDPDGPGATLDVAYQADAIIMVLKYVLRRRLDQPAGAITWKELSGDLRRVRGGWWVEATDVPGVSRATYRAFVDMSRFVPTRLIVRGARSKATEMIDRVRRIATEIHAARDD